MLLPLLLKVAAQSPPLTDYLWLKKIDLVFNKNFDLYIGAPSIVVYRDFMKSLPDIVDIDKTHISKLEQWEEKYQLK